MRTNRKVKFSVLALAAMLTVVPITEFFGDNQVAQAAKTTIKANKAKIKKAKAKKVVKKHVKKTVKRHAKKAPKKIKKVKKATKKLNKRHKKTIKKVNKSHKKIIKRAKKQPKQRLTRAAYVYDKNGRKNRKLKLVKKGKSFKILGTKNIKKVKYYLVGKNMYVKAANFKKPAKKHINKERLSAIKNKDLQKFLDSQNFKGTATVYKNGQKVWSETNANQPESSYLINSVQKALTTGMLMKLVQQHKIKLTDKVSKFYPQVPNANRITIMNLLEMTSGLTQTGDFGTKPFVSDAKNAQQMIKSLGFNEDLYGKWNYQDGNFVLLSHILEKVSHQSYEKLFDKTYTQPLKLKNTHFMWSKNKNIAPATKKFDMDETHGMLGAASVAMSNDDLYTALNGLLTGKVLTRAQRKVAYAPGHSESKYRGGLYSRDGYYSSNGAGYGYYTFVRISKDGKNAIILQTNAGSKYKAARSNADTFYQLAFSSKQVQDAEKKADTTQTAK